MPSNPNPFQPNPPTTRLTQPKGTFLSSPSTAADGFFGGAQPSNIPQIGAQVGTPAATTAGYSSFENIVKRLFDFRTVSDRLYDSPSQPKQPQGFVGNVPGGMSGNPINKPTTYTSTPSGIFNQSSGANQTVNNSITSQTHNLIGADIAANPNEMNFDTLQTIFPGRSAAEIQSFMQAKGYTYQAYPYGGGTFVLTNPQAAQSSQANMLQTNFGNQVSFTNGADVGASLARGEKLKVSAGYNMVGGAKTTVAQGTTPAGTSQYAVTYGTVDKKLEAKGAYKWTSKTVKDKNGNWVKVYEKVLRGPYSKGGQQQQAVNAERRQAQQQQQQDQNQGQTFNQLVTMRVNYG